MHEGDGEELQLGCIRWEDGAGEMDAVFLPHSCLCCLVGGSRYGNREGSIACYDALLVELDVMVAAKARSSREVGISKVIVEDLGKRVGGNGCSIPHVSNSSLQRLSSEEAV